MRLGPLCGALLSELRDLVLREASLELSSPVVFEDMAALRRLDMEGCTSSRTGSWLSRVLGSSSDAVAMPAGLVELRAMGCNVFDKCALHLGAATGLQLLELSSSMQLPATLKHAAPGATLGLHIAEEAQVRASWCASIAGCPNTWPQCWTGWWAVPRLACRPADLASSCHSVPCHPPLQVVTRLGRDTVSVKACLAGRLPSIQRLSACALGRSSLAVLDSMPELRQLCLLEGERRRLELEVHLPQLETCRVEGYQIIKARPWASRRGAVVCPPPLPGVGWMRSGTPQLLVCLQPAV